MRLRSAILLLTLHTHALAQTGAAPASPSAPTAAAPAAPVISPEWAAESAPPSARERAIKDAVRAVIAEQGPAQALEPGAAFRSTEGYARFERAVEEARVPGCLRPDGLKHQPTSIFKGLLALPFIAVAKARGKCN